MTAAPKHTPEMAALISAAEAAHNVIALALTNAAIAPDYLPGNMASVLYRLRAALAALRGEK